jgi:death-on-curing protein
MRYLTLAEILDLHARIIEQTGGATGIRDLGSIESALAQPQMTFGGQDLYSTIESKASALCFSLVMNHAFVDGNKRIGHGAMETFLVLNGFELASNLDDSEQTILQLAAGKLTRDQLTEWVATHVRRVP